jgi:hypothetical protein
MPLNFSLVATNPNDTTGGGGSLAGPMHDTDAVGPFFIWPFQEFDSAVSPHCVVAASEVEAMARVLAGDGVPLAGGEYIEVHSVPADAEAPNPTGQGGGDPAVSGPDEVDYNDAEAFHRAVVSE